MNITETADGITIEHHGITWRLSHRDIYTLLFWLMHKPEYRDATETILTHLTAEESKEASLETR